MSIMEKHKNFKQIIADREKKNAVLTKQIEQYNADLKALEKKMQEELDAEKVEAYADTNVAAAKVRAKIEAVNLIIEKAGSGYSGEEVVDEWQKYMEERKKKIDPLVSNIAKKRKELLDLMIEAARVNASYIPIREDMRRFYKIGKGGKCDTDKIIKRVPAAVEWGVNELRFFADDLRKMGKDGKAFEISAFFAGNVAEDPFA